LKSFDLERRFQADAGELPPMAVQYVAGLVKVAPSELVKNEWPSRAIKYHRAQIRAALPSFVCLREAFS
jgi:hypothetical protein